MEPGGAHVARGSGGRVSGQDEPDDLGEVSDRAQSAAAIRTDSSKRRSSSGRRRLGRSPATARSPIRRKSSTASTKSRASKQGLPFEPWVKRRRDSSCSPTNLPSDAAAAKVAKWRVTKLNAAVRVSRDPCDRRASRLHAKRVHERRFVASLCYVRRAAARLAITSPTMRVRASCIRRRAMARTTYNIWLANIPATKDIPFTVDEDGKLHERSARLRRAGRSSSLKARTIGKDGPANKAVIDALIEAGRSARARAVQALLSAFVAFQSAADLPRHAAMVHRAG